MLAAPEYSLPTTSWTRSAWRERRQNRATVVSLHSPEVAQVSATRDVSESSAARVDLGGGLAGVNQVELLLRGGVGDFCRSGATGSRAAQIVLLAIRPTQQHASGESRQMHHATQDDRLEQRDGSLRHFFAC